MLWRNVPSIQLPARALSPVLKIVYEYLCALYETFSNFISTTMKFDYHHCADKIWNESKNVREDWKIFNVAINNIQQVDISYSDARNAYLYRIKFLQATFAINILRLLYTFSDRFLSPIQSWQSCLDTVPMQNQNTSYYNTNINVSMINVRILS